MKRYIVAGCLLALTAGAGAAWHMKERVGAVLHSSKTADGKPRIEIKNIRTKRTGASERPAKLAAPGRAPTPEEGLADAIPPRAPDVTVNVRTLDGQRYLKDLSTAVKLTEEERTHLSVVLRDVDHMQRQIDKKSDAARKSELQYKLIQQLVVRLRLVLGEERARRAADELERDNPRVVFAGSAPI